MIIASIIIIVAMNIVVVVVILTVAILIVVFQLLMPLFVCYIYIYIGNLVDKLALSNHLRTEGEEPEILKAGRRRERNGSLRDGSGGDRGDGQLKTKPTQVEDREEEEQEKEKDEVREESQRRNIAGTNRGYNIKYTLTMLKKIVSICIIILCCF